MTNLGFKKLTKDNWLEPDEVVLSLMCFSNINEWLREILKAKLINIVPIEVQKLFEVARGALAYGYFFYPLYTLAGERFFRVVETAITIKCNVLKAPNSIDTFQKKLKWLINNKVIPESEEGEWDSIRILRNITSHPKNQNILPPGPIINKMKYIADKINSLFMNS